MRMVFGLVLVLGVALAAFAVYMAKGYVDSYQARLEAERAQLAKIVPTVEVYVTNRQIKYGEEIGKDDVRRIKWPEDSLPEGVFRTEEELFPKGTGIPRRATRQFEKNEPVLAAKVTEPGRIVGITSRLSRGMRAFAIKVDATSGVSGFLRPGDVVDVYWTGRILDQNVTKLIRSGLKLIAVDQKTDIDQDGAVIARTVTVEVTPEDVAALAQAQATGRLSLSLVGNAEDVVSGKIEIDQDKLLGIKREAVVETVPDRVCTIRQRKGTEIVEVEINCPD